jgi:hypothetical protein
LGVDIISVGIDDSYISEGINSIISELNFR